MHTVYANIWQEERGAYMDSIYMTDVCFIHIFIFIYWKYTINTIQLRNIRYWIIKKVGNKPLSSKGTLHTGSKNKNIQFFINGQWLIIVLQFILQLIATPSGPWVVAGNRLITASIKRKECDKD